MSARPTSLDAARARFAASASRRALALSPIALLLVVACGRPRRPVEPEGNHCYEEPFAPNVQPEEAMSRDEANAVGPWLHTTIWAMREGMGPTKLESLAARRPTVWLSLEAGTRTLPELGKLLRQDDGLRGNNPWWMGTVLRLEGFAERNATFPDGFESGSGPGDAAFAGTGAIEKVKDETYDPKVAMRVGRVHLDRWLSKDPVERSCAVNVLAHEIAHTVSRGFRAYRPYFADTGTGAPEGPAGIATTLIATSAQCEYLREAKRIPDTRTALEKCLDTFGAWPFPAARCDDFAGAATEIEPSAPAAPTAKPSRGVLPMAGVPLVVLSSDPAHCPADAPTLRGAPATSLGKATQCFHFEGDAQHLYRVVLAPAERQESSKKTLYRMCVDEIGERPKDAPKPRAGDTGASVDVAIGVADLPEGKPLWVENAVRWRKDGPEITASPCEGREPVVVVKAAREEALPRRADRATGQVLGRGLELRGRGRRDR